MEECKSGRWRLRLGLLTKLERDEMESRFDRGVFDVLPGV